ncbi:fumarylacetoacetate hydrolase family protein [Ramlibacter sp. AW1]|uniref:Fumarylacetoacetate hydrolase family protein n=1 Tax=Ramlibacter aurantiacus TaxID=2801330 RepID=A0A936ZLD1_9BURK|nr:fumarylacetoacetate hydrolase family protein [Ramlibacter aurantiacus]MBL0423012.1 fumarylacetoacetate hydrolase family protein [Ramlibacter aurantiacus]
MTIQLVSYRSAGDAGVRTGLLLDGRIYASGRYGAMQEVLDDWTQASTQLAGLPAKLREREPVAGAQLVAPLPNPRTIYFAGANYLDHVDEMSARSGMPLERDPKGKGYKPWFAIKASGPSIAGPGAQVSAPAGTRMLDWEIELAVVIGQRCRNLPRERAHEVIAGYTVANDLSARDAFAREGVAGESPFKWDWIGQKSFDGSCPIGPAITPQAFIGDPMNLAMKLWVNGELMQDSNTSQMLFDIGDQLAQLSSRITLQPGDLVLTGTPAGVGMGRGVFLQPGDVVRQWIQNIGEFEFSIAAEPAT